MVVAHAHPELSIGGGEHAAYSLFRHLRSKGDVEAAFLAWAPPVNATDAASVLPYGDRAGEFLFRASGFDAFLLSQNPATTTVLAEAISTLAPHVVHLHHYINVGVELIGALRRLLPEVKTFVTLHEYRAICHHHGLMVKTHQAALCEKAEDGACAACFAGTSAESFARRRMRIRHYLDQADRLLAPSRFLRKRYIEWGVHPKRIVVIENGVEQSTLSPPPVEQRRPGDEFPCTFGFFGQIHPFKGLHCLLEALDRAVIDMPRIRLSIHGAHLEANDPSYISLVKGLIDRHRERIRFMGPYRATELGTLMRAVHWVVVPSLWWENAPLVIEEAFSHNRPVLCSAIGGMKENVRPSKDGFHFAVGDTAALASLMLRVGRDRPLWERLQRTVRRPVSAAESAGRHLQLYRGKH